MTVGQIMVVCGICLVLVAVLLAVVGSVLLHKKKKMVLPLIQWQSVRGASRRIVPSYGSDSGR